MTGIRCLAMTSKVGARDGHRCVKPAVDGKLCAQHLKHGALIPDAWSPTGLPVFHIVRRLLPGEVAQAHGELGS